MDVQQQRRTLWSTLMGVFVTAWPSVILIAALPTIAASLDTDASTLAWVITLPLLVSSVLLPTFGRLGDLYGHRRVFLWGLGLSIVTAGMTALAWDAWSLILFRTLSQTAGVATIPTAIALIMAAFEPKDRPKALGAWSGVTAFSPALGLMFGGPLVALLGWRGVFVMQMLLAAAFFPMCRKWLQETALAERVGFDIVGGISLMIASGSVLFFFDRASAWGWSHPSIFVAAAVFPVALLVFVRAERRASDPLLPPGLFRSRRFTAPVTAEVLSIVAGNGAFFAAPLLLTEVFDTSVVSTSFLMLPLPLGMAIGSPVGGRVAVRIGERNGGTIGAVAMTVAMGFFLVGFLQESLWVFVVGLVLMGVAHGMMRPATASAAGNALQPEFFGVGMATMRMTSQLGGAAGISIAVTATALGGFGWYYAVAAVISFAPVVAVRFVLSQRHPVTDAERTVAEELIETEAALTISPSLEGVTRSGPTIDAIDVLMVCSGNTCRSPMAMVLLGHHLAELGVEAPVHSAGTLGWGGPATENSAAVMAERGLDLSGHESRRLDAGLVIGADLVLGMTRDHVTGVLIHDPTAVDRTFVIGEVVRLGTQAGTRRADQSPRRWTDAVAAKRPEGRRSGRVGDEIADPVGEPLDVYRRTADRLDELTRALAVLLAPAIASDLAG